MTPRFKQGDYAGGLDAGLDRLMPLIRGEGLPTPTQGGSGDWLAQGFQWQNLLVFLFFGVLFGGAMARRVLGNKLGALATAGVVGVVVKLVTASLLIAGAAGFFAMLFTLLSGFGRGTGSSSGVSRGWGGSHSSGGGWSSGSSSGGGGFSSGGGGDFGGGGASGDW